MTRDQEAAVMRAFVDEMGAGPHNGTEAFGTFLSLQNSRVGLFDGIPGDPWQQVHALLNRRGLTRG
jgi:hypothetical protein